MSAPVITFASTGPYAPDVLQHTLASGAVATEWTTPEGRQWRSWASFADWQSPPLQELSELGTWVLVPISVQWEPPEHVAVTILYSNDAITLYPRVPWWWIVAQRATATIEGKGHNGYLAHQLRTAQELLKPVTIRKGRSMVGEAARRRERELIEEPGLAEGFAATLEMMT